MKKLLLIAIAVASQMDTYAQVVPNGDFENWNSTSYNEPEAWETQNKDGLSRLGIAPVSKVSGYSGFAIRLQTSTLNGDTSYAYFSNGSPQGESGGAPYSQKPSALTGYYRYNLPVNDTALILVLFKKGGSVVSTDLLKIKGTGSQNTFISFSIPLSLSVTPDTVIIAAAASNLMSNVGVQNGSFLELDQLIFTGSGITQQLANNEFENWTALTNDVPVNWGTWGEGVSKSTSSYEGTYAVRLETTILSQSGITTGQMTHQGPKGGRPYTGNINDTLCGYYKFFPVGNDTATIHMQITTGGYSEGSGNKIFTVATPNYTYFEFPFQAGYPVKADTLSIEIQSSSWYSTQANVGSVLYIDKLWLKSDPSVGIFEIGNTSVQSTSYPNPAKDVVFIRSEKNISGQTILNLYDVSGRKTEKIDFTVNANSVTLDVSKLSSGIYFYEIISAEGYTKNKFIKE